MKFILLLKASKDSEAGVMPTTEQMVEMGKYNQEMIDAGIMLAGEGLMASSKGARVDFVGDKRIVTDGPFAETKELVAGFWIIQVKSKQEAIDWVKRCPSPMGSADAQIEIRQVFTTEDFAPILETSEEGRAVLDMERSFNEQSQQPKS